MRQSTYFCDVCGCPVDKPGQLLLRGCEADLCIVCLGAPWAKKLIALVAEHAGEKALGNWAQAQAQQWGPGRL